MCDKVEDLGQLPNGCHLFRHPNGAGGHTYTSDEISQIGVVVWDTCSVDRSTLLAAIVAEEQRKIKALHTKRVFDSPSLSTQVQAGDIISLTNGDAQTLSFSPGEYVVEEAEFHGGWCVKASKLDRLGRYKEGNEKIQFYQDVGYVRHILNVRVVGKMKKTFV